MCALLVAHGPQALSVTTVGSLREAEAVLLGRPADLVVANLVLPDAAGSDVVRTLRACAPLAAIVGLTACDDRDLGLEAVRLGASGYLVKGEGEGAALVRQMLHALELRRMIQTLADEHARMEHIATHDPLTGLPNRALLFDRLGQAIEAVKRNDRHLAVMFVDLDGFKELNDTLGHAAGDELLGAVAARLRQALRASDTVARLGGDEFVLLCTHLASVEDGCLVAHKIAETLGLPFALQGRSWSIGASVGVALHSGEGVSSAELMRRADLAMYSAKDSGGRGYAIYREELEQWPPTVPSALPAARS